MSWSDVAIQDPLPGDGWENWQSRDMIHLIQTQTSTTRQMSYVLLLANNSKGNLARDWYSCKVILPPEGIENKPGSPQNQH